eukprot:9816827-Alexandrium_andersonii.AAC.1
MAAHALWAPATWPSHAAGLDPSTWTNSKGGRHRIDYVLLPQCWRTCHVEAIELQALDLALERPDHEPAAMAVSIPR